MTELANKLGLIRKDGILMTKEEAAGGFDRDIARQNFDEHRCRAAFLSSFESLKAEANGLGVSERPGHSLRLSVHRARADLPEGVQAALQRSDAKEARRNGGSTSARASGFATATKASTSQPQDRVKFVANAVATDPACKGKAATAIKMLADPDYANVSASGIVKLLKAGASAEAPTAQSVADRRDKAMRAEMKAAINTTGNSKIAPDGGRAGGAANHGWSRVIADMNARNGFKAEASSAAGSGGSWGGAIAKMNRLNGFK